MKTKIKLENRNEHSYNEEYFLRLIARLGFADRENLMNYCDLGKIDKVLDDCVISHLKYAIREYMSYNAKLEKNERQPNNWIDLTFSDTNITLDISIGKDQFDRYYLLSYDNIRKVTNEGSYRFSIKEIQDTQEKIKEITQAVFDKFNGKGED